MTTQLATTSGTALEYVGSPDDRVYLMEIMAEQLGIPARDAQKQKVVALIANAVERNREYGWRPGIHMHVQAFTSKDDRTGEETVNYTLVDGEKAWKDSGAQWRLQHGLVWRYQRRAMTQDEVTAEAISMGCEKSKIAPNASGIWCRIVILGEDDPKDPENPFWSSGTWFGQIKVGKWFRTDGLPTGVTPRDVAIRRADKRAMMQSTLTLLPVDNLTPDERSAKLSAELRREHMSRNQRAPDTAQRQRFQYEDDGEVLWAVDNVAEAAVAEVEESTEPESTDPENDIDFSQGSTEPKSTEPKSTEVESFSPYAELIHNPDYALADAAKGIIEIFKGLEEQSTRQMSAVGWDKLVQKLRDLEVLFAGKAAAPVLYFFEALTATYLGEKRPGEKIGKPLLATLEYPDQLKAMRQIASCVQTIYEEE